MHSPENMDGNTYIELVAAVSVALARNFDAKSTFLLAEFIQAVGNQLITLAIFKEAEEIRIKKRREKEAELAKKYADQIAKENAEKKASQKDKSTTNLVKPE